VVREYENCAFKVSPLVEMRPRAVIAGRAWLRLTRAERGDHSGSVHAAELTAAAGTRPLQVLMAAKDWQL